MEVGFWPTVDVGVALAGLQWRMHASLNGRLDRMEGRIDTRMDHVEERIDTRLSRIEERIDRIEVRMDHPQAGLTSVEERLSRIAGWIAGRFHEETAPEQP